MSRFDLNKARKVTFDGKVVSTDYTQLKKELRQLGEDTTQTS
ncbi:MAG: hypothetical protein ACFFCQ_03630 [Promethearchaeota archaeon]